MLALPGRVWAKRQNHQVGPQIPNSSELARVPSMTRRPGAADRDVDRRVCVCVCTQPRECSLPGAGLGLPGAGLGLLFGAVGPRPERRRSTPSAATA